jgi:hypothetical protein
MKPSVRPATTLVPTPVPTVPAPVAQYQAALPTPASRPAEQSAREDEAASQAQRDFYAWCAGCEGYGSIF